MRRSSEHPYVASRLSREQFGCPATKAQTRPPPLHVRSARSGEPHLGLELASRRCDANALRADRGCARGRLGTRGLGCMSRKVGNAPVLRSGRAGEKERRRKKAGERRIGPEFVFLRVSFGPAARRSRIGRAHLLQWMVTPMNGECARRCTRTGILMVSQEPGLECGGPPASCISEDCCGPQFASMNQLSDAGICRWPASICWNLLKPRKCERRSPSGVAGSWGMHDKSPVVRCAARPQVNSAAMQVEMQMQLHDKSPFIRNRGPPMAISLPYPVSPRPLSCRCILLPPGPAASQTPAYPRTNPGGPSANRSMN